MEQVLQTIKRLMPRRVFRALQPGYHFALNALAAVLYGFPSRKMIVIGITGTTGKTTGVYLLADVLRRAGLKVGYTSTALLSDGESDWLNDKKMTMLGRFFTQKMLSVMRANSCDIAIVETTSEGIVQFRHRFIDYDVVVFTGLYPEHIQSHGSFENYKAAKIQLFTHLARTKHKTGLKMSVSKTIVVNGNDEHAADFIAPWAEQKVAVCRAGEVCVSGEGVVQKPYAAGAVSARGIGMTWNGEHVQLPLFGEFSVTNAAMVGAVASVCGADDLTIRTALELLPDVPGRFERIVLTNGATAIVDYAFEPVAMGKLYETVEHMQPMGIIHVLGGTGGGRDASRRPILGKMAAEHARYVIVTDEDPYDDDPRGLMEDVAAGVREGGKVEGENFEIIEDRAEAITRAVRRAQPGEIVLITGKGSEQAICGPHGTMTPHDDRSVVRAADTPAPLER